MTNAQSTNLPIYPTVLIQPTRGLAALQLRALWEYRELLFFLAWRDIKVRYKQTALGVAWIVLQPLLSTVVFTLLFGGLLKVPSDGAPYAVFALAALAPWQYFAGSLSRVGGSLINSANLRYDRPLRAAGKLPIAALALWGRCWSFPTEPSGKDDFTTRRKWLYTTR